MLVILRFGDESALIIDSMKYCHYITLKRFHSIGSQILSYQPVKCWSMTTLAQIQICRIARRTAAILNFR